MLATLEQDQIWAGVIVDPLAVKLEHDGIAKALYDTRTEKGTLDIFGGPWPAGGFYFQEDFIRQQSEEFGQDTPLFKTRTRDAGSFQDGCKLL